MNSSNMIRRVVYGNSVIVVLLMGCLFIYPSLRAIVDIRDPRLRNEGVPKVGWRLYKNLSPRYAGWAKKRVTAGNAETLNTSDISGTEWPLFGSVFYLWAIENLQAAWDAGDRTVHIEPRTYAKEAIIAASELVVDPRHATWVKKHWGNNYLHRENIFYRMLVIGALTSREKLLRDGAHIGLLRDQVTTLAKELDSSETGLLDDYPGECYPGDVMAAWMCIKRADAVLGTDHSEVIKRALRGFTGIQATPRELPPYAANSRSGFPLSDSRGCGNSYMCLTSPELWPAQAKEWFGLHDKLFWQERFTGAGFREFVKDVPRSDWYMDVDSGPVIAGYGIAASAFGIGASRKNGRFDRAYPLQTEMLALFWELPNGVLAMPRLLSNASDAPLLGEAAILWQLSIQPEKGFPVISGGRIPPFVFIVLTSLFVIGALGIWKAVRMWRQAAKVSALVVWCPKLQAGIWLGLAVCAAAAFWLDHAFIGIAMLIATLVIPITKQRSLPTPAEARVAAETHQKL